MISLMASNGEYFDLSDRGVIAITIQPNNLGDLNTRSGISSYEFTIPLTAKNIQLLTSNTVECSIYSNNRVLAYGNLTVYEKDLINRTALCSFIGAVSWFDRIKDLMLTDCSLDLTHIYSVDNILSSFNNTSGFIYAPAEFGRSYNEFTPIFNTTTNDIMPSVYVSSLVRSILDDAGIGVTGELFDDEIFNNTVVFCPNVNYDVNVLQVSVIGGSQTVTGLDEILSLLNITTQTIEGYFDTVNYVFTNIGATTLQLKYSIFVAAQSSSLNNLGYELKYDIDGVKTSLKTGTVVAGADFTYINNNGTLTIPIGSVLSFYLSKTSGTGNIEITTNKFSGTSQELINDALVNPVLLLPEMTQQDFMKWVVVSFGVILSYDDVSNTLTFNLFKNVPFKTANDWSSKVSKVASENIRELTQGYARTNYMAYEGNSDDTLLKNLTDAQLKGSFSINDDSLEAEIDYYTSPFCATLQSVSFQGEDGYLYLPNIQRFAVEQESVASGQIEAGMNYTISGASFTIDYNGTNYTDGQSFTGVLNVSNYSVISGDGYVYKDVSEETVDPLPRVLIVRRGVDVSDLSGGTFTEITVTDGTTPQTSTTMPYSYFHPTVNVNDYLESLSYGLMGLVNLGQTTMIDTYLSYIIDVIENRQLVKFQMALNDVDLNSLDYSKPIYIEAGEYTGQYFLNKIDGYDGQSLTDVYLMKLV